MQVAFGTPVFGSDGKRLGDVDGLVVDAGTKRATAIVVDAGLLDRTPEMVAVAAIRRSDDTGIHLDAPAATIAAEEEGIASEEVARPTREPEPIAFIPAAGVGGPVVTSDPAIPGEYPDDTPFFDIAPIDPPPVEIVSDLEENEVVLHRGTEAVSADGEKLGEVVAFTLGDMGLVDAVAVSEGFIFKHRAGFALADIDEFGTDRVHLRLSEAEAAAR
jgi:uncharacterized protein YrrD